MSDSSLAVPAAFLSYARSNDQNDEDGITHFRTKLAGAVSTFTGDPFDIFQDRHGISVGQQWKERIEETLNSTTLLIAILTPTFFKSDYCRSEVKQFVERERQLKRHDLMIPVHYVPVPALKREEPDPDELINVFKARQLFDAIELRYLMIERKLTAVRQIDQLAQQIVEALNRFPKVDRAQSIDKQQADRRERHSPLSPGVAEQIAQTARLADQPATAVQPPTRVVDALRGPYRTPLEAVGAADPGDRILIRAGTYDQGLTIDKPLEIIGEANASEVVLQATGAHAIAFRTTLGRIANLTLRQLGGEYFAVDIAQGRLSLEGCRIESASSAGIAVHGAEADPIVRNNRINGCLKGGVILLDHALGTLEENEIDGNHTFGVIIRGGANPVLRGNRIHDNAYGGVMVDAGAGRFEGNGIFANRGEGVLVAGSSDPDLQRNRIFKNDKAGVYVYDGAKSTIKANEIFENRESGIAIRTMGDPVIQENRITANNGKGVWCSDRAAGVVENNDLRGNYFGAFWKSDDCLTRYVGNKE